MNILNNMFKNILNSFSRSIGRILSYILIFIVVMLLCAKCTKALTINDSNRTVGESYLTLFENIYDRSNYLHYVIVGNNASYNNNYYLCLTNEEIDTSNALKINTICDLLYTYYYSNNNYSLSIKQNEELIVNNSIYYTDVKYNRSHIYILSSILLILTIFLFFYIFTKVLNNRSTGGLHYEKVK